MTDEKLKPCPFCGGVDIESYQVKPSWTNPYWTNPYWRIGCLNCGRYFVAADCTEDEAIEAWNRRANYDV